MQLFIRVGLGLTILFQAGWVQASDLADCPDLSGRYLCDVPKELTDPIHIITFNGSRNYTIDTRGSDRAGAFVYNIVADGVERNILFDTTYVASCHRNALTVTVYNPNHGQNGVATSQHALVDPSSSIVKGKERKTDLLLTMFAQDTAVKGGSYPCRRLQ